MNTLNENGMRMIKTIIAILILVVLMAGAAILSVAAPVGPTVTFTFNETAIPQSAALLNSSGGSITTMRLNTTAQNLRWKAYVGNVTGQLQLDDALGSSVFEWDLSTITGEVFATHSSDTINWTNVNCTWSHTGVSTDRTTSENENLRLNHTHPDDNITATFETRDHDQFFVGTTPINADTCYSIHTYVNDTSQSTSFQEVLLYDGSDSSDGNVLYTAILEDNATGFDGTDYDFQMIVPENGLATWTSSTAYYFYVEIT